MRPPQPRPGVRWQDRLRLRVVAVIGCACLIMAAAASALAFWTATATGPYARRSRHPHPARPDGGVRDTDERSAELHPPVRADGIHARSVARRPLGCPTRPAGTATGCTATTLTRLRHSYVTHLIEDGFDPYFVQRPVGHAWGATTGLYTGVNSDFKNKSLRDALARLTADETGAG